MLQRLKQAGRRVPACTVEWDGPPNERSCHVRHSDQRDACQENFDYEGLFRNRALMRCGLRTPEFEQQCILGGDSHPSSYLDTNGSAQQFEEFYETYDVQEGDGMYLAPEDRIPIW